MFSRCLQLQRQLNLGRKTINMVRKQSNDATHLSVQPNSVQLMSETSKRPYEDEIKVPKGVIEGQKEDLMMPYEGKIKLLNGIIEDKHAEVERQKKDLMKQYEDKIKTLEGIIKDKKVDIERYRKDLDTRNNLLQHVQKLEIAKIQDNCLREMRYLHCRGVLEYIANSVSSVDREGVQPKLNRIAKSESFRSILKELCAELKISEVNVEQSRQKIYEWFCSYTHTGEGSNCLTINTSNTDYPTSIAVSYLAYLRELRIKHSYVIGEQVLKWPSL
ncbi:hypothetical protein BGX38DRAFT_1208517 [Terfezia claveryi]|nr:hypothetical protein BGX38DRAFT_1208517 [Terfezia claveryi]